MNPTAFIPRQALRRGARLRSADGRSFAVDAAAARRASPMAASPQALLPPPQTADEQKLVVVLDMDLTMIEARQGEHPLLPDSFRIKLPEFNNVTYTVHKRPGLDAFLAEACTKYELVAFTAGTQPYATQILDHLDPKSVIFRHRLYRQHCRPFGPFLVRLRGLPNPAADSRLPGTTPLPPRRCVAVHQGLERAQPALESRRAGGRLSRVVLPPTGQWCALRLALCQH
jgi:hypothetical protein